MSRSDGTALLVIDVQQGLVDRMGFGTDYVARVRQAVAAARAASVPVVYARMAFRDGAPEVRPGHRMLSGIARSGMLTNAAPTSQIHSLLDVRPEDAVVTRARVSAFKDSDLDAVLRAQRIQHLAIAGNATRAGVLATVLEASDRDYEVTILSDCCTDHDPAVHEFFMKEVLPLHARVVALAEWAV